MVVPRKEPRLGIKKADLSVLNDDSYGELAFANADYYVTENGGEFVVYGFEIKRFG